MLSRQYARYVSFAAFGPDLQAFAAIVPELQEKRNAADYDPLIRLKSSDALLALSTARTALRRYGQADEAERKAFLSLLLFQPR